MLAVFYPRRLHYHVECLPKGGAFASPASPQQDNPHWSGANRILFQASELCEMETASWWVTSPPTKTRF